MTVNHRESENVILSVGAGVMSLMLLYALATDVAGLAKPGTRVLAFLTLAISAIALIGRYIRLRNLGTQILVLDLPDIVEQDRPKYWLWLWAAAFLGVYSVYELYAGGFVLGVIGSLASVSSMFVLARGLIRREPEGRERERGRC